MNIIKAYQVSKTGVKSKITENSFIIDEKISDEDSFENKIDNDTIEENSQEVKDTDVLELAEAIKKTENNNQDDEEKYKNGNNEKVENNNRLNTIGPNTGDRIMFWAIVILIVIILNVIIIIKRKIKK